MTIGAYFVGSGIPIHLWPEPPVLGGPGEVKMLTQDIREVLGGYFYMEENPVAAADRMD
jgi:carbon-monoxide dehydrogenase catalytic subunit